MSLFDSGIIPAINDHLLKESEKIRDYGDYWSASSAGYCMRKVIFERLGVPPVNEDARKQRVFSSGHIFHEWIQGITKESGLSIAQELELQDEELMIRGHIDDLVLIREVVPEIIPANKMVGANGRGEGIDPREVKLSPIKEHLILYDYKTAHSKWFEYVKDRPMSHYNRMQLGTYMYMLRKDNAYTGNGKLTPELGGINVGNNIKLPLTEARILKISKDDLRLHEQQLLWSPELEKDVVGYWSTINGYWKNERIPRCTCAEFEINKKTGVGFMADPRYNQFYFEGEPCSLKWYQQWKEQKHDSLTTGGNNSGAL